MSTVWGEIQYNRACAVTVFHCADTFLAQRKRQSGGFAGCFAWGIEVRRADAGGAGTEGLAPLAGGGEFSEHTGIAGEIYLDELLVRADQIAVAQHLCVGAGG